MVEPIVLKEYEEKDIESCDFDKLQCYLKRNDLEKALKVTRYGVEANSWVGVIKYKNTHFQILPKLISEKDNIEDENTRAQILNNLIFMLSYTKNLDIKTTDNSKLSKEKNPFIEILIREYAKSLFDCLKRLTPKRYVRAEDNLNYLKGKIKFTENIRFNCANQAKFYCEFDEFSENNILNQLFLFVSTCLYNISNNNENKKILKFIINYYSDIKMVRFDRFKADKIKLSRNQEFFRKPFNLAKMFVEKTSVDLSKNKFENISLVWDMNVLFEEFIFRLIQKYITDWTAQAQKGRKLLIGANSKYRNTYVDILLENKNDKIILDTKYKKFKNEHDFVNADVFQVTTYCLIHGTKKAVLLYPQYSDEFCIKNQLNADDEINQYQIKFCTVNLKYENLSKNISTIVEQIKSIYQ